MSKYNFLKKYFGFDKFLEGQEYLVDSILTGRDCLGIMPTGGGKSLCYQLPALLLPGVTIVVSPLISLMKDQVDSLREMGIAATYINSTVPNDVIYQRTREIAAGKYKLVYVAPERLNTNGFLNLTQRITIPFVAVDEAHCISQWGHDFRPSYAQIPLFIENLSKRPVVAAFTATATKHIIKDIKFLLHLNQPLEISTGFDRPNLFYRVIKPQDKFKYILQYLKDNYQHESGIIYCSTRKTVESLTQKLQEQGFRVEGYHGAMDAEVRKRAQENFMFDKTQIIVATNAFGMGIDKPDVRFVVHYNMPKNMEAYYQEAGRAGRDGNSSECLLLYSPSDIVKQKLIISSSGSDEVREQLQYNNLQHLVNYCHTNDCLRKVIIEYFEGEAGVEKCNNCGNCLDQSELIDVTVKAQKILSCIYKSGQRFGVRMIINILRGSKEKRILQQGLDQISTYALMTDSTVGEVRELIMTLIAEGYIYMTADSYPVLKLLESAKPILKGKQAIYLKQARLNIPPKSEKKQLKSAANLAYNQELFTELAALRSTIGAAKNIPNYIIFHNSALQAMAYYLPATKEEMLQIKGIGEKKYESYGQQFLDLIVQFCATNNLTAPAPTDTAKDSSDQVKTDRYQLTYQQYLQGKSLKEIAQARELTISTIISHFHKCLERGYSIDLTRYLSQQKLDHISTVTQQHHPQSLKQLKELLPAAYTYNDIKLAQLILQPPQSQEG